MSDPITVVTHTGLGERLKSSCTGIVFGIILFLGSFPLLFWNEQRAVQRYDALREGEEQTLPLTTATVIDTANEGRLVHFYASVYREGSESLTDPIFGISCSDCLALQRHSDMYQWRESSTTETKKELGGGETTTTTYTYDLTWSESLISSSSFQDQSSLYENPTAFDYPARDIIGDPIMAGAFDLPSSIVSYLVRNEDPMSVQVTDIIDTSLQSKTSSYPSRNGFFIGSGTLSSPMVGDERVWFSQTPPTDISVVGVQRGDTLEPFVSETGKGGNVLLYRTGNYTAGELYDIAEQQNLILTWVIRFGGFVLMAFGQTLIWNPFKVAADIIPCVGSLVGCGINFISITIAAVLSSITISIAWLIAHPKIGAIVLGVSLVVIGLCAFGVKMILDRNKKDDDEVMVEAMEVEDGKKFSDVEEY